MLNFGSRRGAANLGVPLMALTFLLLAGFLYWLSATAEPTAPPVMEEEADEPVEVADAGTGTEVDPEALKTGASAFEGQTVRLAEVMVSQSLGDVTFFVDLPESDALPPQPFLVRLNPDLVAAGQSVPLNQRVTVVGPLMAMQDSIVQAWLGDGSISPNDQLLVEFATHFIEAEAIQTAGGGGGSAPEGDDAPEGS